MIAFPHAKINIGLNVISKRADGYHNISTCFFPIGWKDALEILPSDEDQFSASGLEIPGDSGSNLCIKALELLQQDFELPPVQIHLHKVIPMGAGLGGGSADAAFTIKVLNEIFQLKLDSGQMMKYASAIGSDCAFFIQDKPVLAEDKGHLFREITISLKGSYLLVINPGIHVNTAQAYASLKPQQPSRPLEEVLNMPIESWKENLFNDFESTVFKMFPEIASIKSALYDKGAVYASMSGSGSSVYGIFAKNPDLTATFPSHYHIWEQAI